MEERVLYTNQSGQLVSIKPDGTDSKTITSGTQAQISPNGQKIVFNRGGHIYISNIDGSSESIITSGLGSQNRYPSWYPDGSKILFTSERFSVGLYTRDLSGNNEQLVISNSYEGRYSPDGTKIAHGCFISDAEELCVSSSDGLATIAVTDNTTNGDRWPNWSPDGNRVVFRSQIAGQTPTNITTMNPDGTGKTVIHTAVNGGGVDEPAWSPDSSRIVFTNYNPGLGAPFVYRLFVIDAQSGANPQEIVAAGTSHPVWGFIDNDIPHPSEPETFNVAPSADTYVRSGQSNHNQGGSQFMQIQSSGSNRGLVRFDQSTIESAVGNGVVVSAKLRLNITDNGNNWGPTGRTIDLHRLLIDWAEGNGTENDRGTGSGTTWNCAIDSAVQNQAKDCTAITEWEMGQPNNPSVHPWAETAAATQTITNGQTGIIEFDVTSDLIDFLNNEFSNYGWVIKKTNEGQNGQAQFGARESSFAPELVITYQP